MTFLLQHSPAEMPEDTLDIAYTLLMCCIERFYCRPVGTQEIFFISLNGLNTTGQEVDLLESYGNLKKIKALLIKIPK